ncbi:TRAP-type mannitol/chloroaromatic compound transport system, small permease component [Cognatiyoonia koreensis]|uniref:TRAP transporter small permease protein n=1 Tax=Cognatiyoonia koreensis TaxID=364200 RepID=A0A1I0P602_9RHOB|nr:TRAP transporter small permease subunit [Cognatiyoonia koreensis]SEW09617.1 TRAP-type mannitol/chloroaromatic compound transport system, small permease component [Cognatiyoonia koreensis]
MKTTEEVIAITDPGEVNRAEHNKGDRFIVFIGNIGAWLFPALMIAICTQVVLRNAGNNQAWLDDLQWWIYGIAVLIGVAYAVTTDSHVRVDVLYDNFSREKQTRISLIAIGWLFLPFIILAWDVSLPYALTSVFADEGSSSPNGLHNLWILKIFMNISFLLIAVACVSALIRLITRLSRPTLSRFILWSLPATMLAVNIAVFYLALGFLTLTAAPEATSRDISRHWFFDDFEFWKYDIKYTVLIGVVLTLIILGLARILDRNKRHEG